MVVLIQNKSELHEKPAVVVHHFAFFPAISTENNPGFFVQFLENDIFGKNPDRSATIFYRTDASQLESTCFSKTSQILSVTVTECCSSIISRNCYIFTA